MLNSRIPSHNFSDLQFSLAMQTETQNNAEVQRETIKRLQQQNEDFQAKELVTESKLAELESLLSWERLQHRNQVQCLQGQLNEKEAKIVKLSKTVEMKVCSFIFSSSILSFYDIQGGSYKNSSSSKTDLC